MPFLSPSVVEPSSHISRKKAIIAVTKSAYAIFHAPPWWPWPPFLIFLTMIGWSFFASPAMAQPSDGRRPAAPKAAGAAPSGGDEGVLAAAGVVIHAFLPLTWPSSSAKVGRSP